LHPKYRLILALLLTLIALGGGALLAQSPDCVPASIANTPSTTPMLVKMSTVNKNHLSIFENRDKFYPVSCRRGSWLLSKISSVRIRTNALCGKLDREKPEPFTDIHV